MSPRYAVRALRLGTMSGDEANQIADTIERQQRALAAVLLQLCREPIPTAVDAAREEACRIARVRECLREAGAWVPAECMVAINRRIGRIYGAHCWDQHPCLDAFAEWQMPEIESCPGCPDIDETLAGTPVSAWAGPG